MEIEIASEIQGLLNETHRKWYFNHQSAKECIYGSDGVGHDLIHPADQLEASLRNLRCAYQAVRGMEFTKQERELTIEELEEEFNCLPEGREKKKAEIRLKKAKFEYEDHCQNLEDRKISMNAFLEHAKYLLPKVSEKYKDHDDALEDAWISRIIYNAAVQGHPLGQYLKVSILPEDLKEKALKIMDFPDKFPVPNADNILEKFDNFKNQIGVDEWRKLTQSLSGMATQELTQD